MYEIDISSFWAYIQTMLNLVGGALTLDPAAFQAVFDYQGETMWLLVWIVFIAGLSLMIGQSVVLFANRVTPVRFVVSLVLGALEFVLDVLIFIVVVWVMANILGTRSWAFPQVARAIALASAPYWFSFLVLIPYLGLILDYVLKFYVFLALLVSIQAIFGLGFWNALLGGLVALLIVLGIRTLIGRLLTPLAGRITDAIVGSDVIANTREIYEMFARRNLVQ